MRMNIHQGTWFISPYFLRRMVFSNSPIICLSICSVVFDNHVDSNNESSSAVSMIDDLLGTTLYSFILLIVSITASRVLSKCWLIYYSVFKLKFIEFPFSSLLYCDLKSSRIFAWKFFYSSDLINYLDYSIIFSSMLPY